MEELAKKLGDEVLEAQLKYVDSQEEKQPDPIESSRLFGYWQGLLWALQQLPKES
jgi:hypothetical protein